MGLGYRGGMETEIVVRRVERFEYAGLLFETEQEAIAYSHLLTAEAEASDRRACYAEIDLWDVFAAAKRGFTGDRDESARKICAGIASFMLARTKARGGEVTDDL